MSIIYSTLAAAEHGSRSPTVHCCVWTTWLSKIFWLNWLIIRRLCIIQSSIFKSIPFLHLYCIIFSYLFNNSWSKTSNLYGVNLDEGRWCTGSSNSTGSGACFIGCNLLPSLPASTSFILREDEADWPCVSSVCRVGWQSSSGQNDLRRSPCHIDLLTDAVAPIVTYTLIYLLQMFSKQLSEVLDWFVAK